ncbi:MAG: NDP-sugar synthase [Nanoarchaeota archaeon]|nr:NDP-sugar synthase [Nanoarchaeota archaeon]
MKAIIMAGGYGTRLQPLTLRTPKCVLPIGDTTALISILKQLERVGVNEAVISLNKNQVKVKEFIDSQYTGLKIRYDFEESKEDSDKLGAIGALLEVVKKAGADDCIIVGADNYTQGLDYKKLMEHHKNKKADVTIALFELTDITKVSRFGIGVLNKDSRIIQFQEKPKVEESLSMLASTFIYIVNKEFLKKELPEYVKKERLEGRKPDNIGDLWAYYSDKLRIYGYKFSGYWGDVGKPDYYVEINHKALDMIERHTDKSVKLGNNIKVSGKVIIRKGCVLGDDVIIIGPCIIGENTMIGQGTIINPYTTILRDAEIGKNNNISGSIIFENVKTKDNVKITRALIDGDCIILENNRVEEQAMIGYSCLIGANSQILYNTRLWPFLNVDNNSIINSKIYYNMDYMIQEPVIKKSKYWEKQR